MSALLGHDHAWRTWRAAMAGARMHHGWILTGKRGLGKASFALAAAAELVAVPGVSQPPVESHPDILVLEPLPANDDETKKRDDGKPYTRKRSISVDQVRQMQARLFTRPTLGPRRVVIIDAADDLEKSAVNALLKSLEEPPAGTFFLLVTHRLGRLLPTVRSRCLILRFAPLPDEDVDRALASAMPQLDRAARAGAVAASGGSPGAAMAFAEQDLGTLHPLFERLLREGDPDFSLRAALAPAIGQRPDRERQLAAVEAARMVTAGALRDTSGAAQLRLIEAHEALVRLAGQVPTYNYDAALLVMEIGGLLANVAATREGADQA